MIANMAEPSVFTSVVIWTGFPKAATEDRICMKRIVDGRP